MVEYAIVIDHELCKAVSLWVLCYDAQSIIMACSNLYELMKAVLHAAIVTLIGLHLPKGYGHEILIFSSFIQNISKPQSVVRLS